MKPSELLQSVLEERYLGKRILGWTHETSATAPFTVAAITVDADLEGIEVSFWSSPPTWGPCVGTWPKDLVVHYHNDDHNLPEIIPAT